MIINVCLVLMILLFLLLLLIICYFIFHKNNLTSQVQLRCSTHWVPTSQRCLCVAGRNMTSVWCKTNNTCLQKACMALRLPDPCSESMTSTPCQFNQSNATQHRRHDVTVTISFIINKGSKQTNPASCDSPFRIYLWYLNDWTKSILAFEESDGQIIRWIWISLV